MVVPIIVGVVLGAVTYGLTVAVEAALRNRRRSWESTRIIRSGLGCENRAGGSSAGQPTSRCWCGGVLNGQRTARYPASVRIWCAECGRWSDIKERP